MEQQRYSWSESQPTVISEIEQTNNQQTPVITVTTKTVLPLGKIIPQYYNAPLKFVPGNNSNNSFKDGQKPAPIIIYKQSNIQENKENLIPTVISATNINEHALNNMLRSYLDQVNMNGGQYNDAKNVSFLNNVENLNAMSVQIEQPTAQVTYSNPNTMQTRLIQTDSNVYHLQTDTTSYPNKQQTHISGSQTNIVRAHLVKAEHTTPVAKGNLKSIPISPANYMRRQSNSPQLNAIYIKSAQSPVRTQAEKRKAPSPISYSFQPNNNKKLYSVSVRQNTVAPKLNESQPASAGLPSVRAHATTPPSSPSQVQVRQNSKPNSDIMQQMPYRPNMARQFPVAKERTPEQQVKREKNTLSARVSRRKAADGERSRLKKFKKIKEWYRHLTQKEAVLTIYYKILTQIHSAHMHRQVIQIPGLDDMLLNGNVLAWIELQAKKKKAEMDAMKSK